MNIVRRGVAAAALAFSLVPAVAADGPEARKGSATTQEPRAAHELSPAQEAGWKARRMELDYRDRLGRLRRLREIAVKRGDAARIAEIDRLLHAAQQRHADRVNEVLQGNLDPETRAKLDEELCAGRDPQELAEFRKRMKVQREEFRAKTKQENAEFREGMKEKRGEFREGMKEQRVEHREKVKGQVADHRAEMKDHRSEFRGEVKDRRDAQRDAARAAHEQEWNDARDRARAELGTEREEAVKKIAAERIEADARRGRESQWRRAAARDGSLRDDLGPYRRAEARNRFRMLSQKEADELATMDVGEDNADAEFERLREELAAP